MKRSIILILVSLALSFQAVTAQTAELRVEPPCWWTGMSDPNLQLLVFGADISSSTVLINHPGVHLEMVHLADSPDYLFLDLYIDPLARPGKFPIIFQYQREIVASYEFELKERQPGSAERQGFDPSDVIYLVMPDRFANGDPSNDSHPAMLETADRSDPNGRHGGDLKGIMDHLDYFNQLGVTTLWLNPLLENNMPAYSYHGYAITDFYSIDPRIGSNELYLDFVSACHKRGLKVIMDMVFNHCGSRHWWMQNLPFADWVHQYPAFTRSNFRSETLMDPYASDFDRARMQNGWFDRNMPDLNQSNPFVAEYLIQQSIWWIEYSGADGIRMDTYPYSDQDFMRAWIKRVRKEYPRFNVVGETWLQKESQTSFFQADTAERYGENTFLPAVTDFPLKYALADAFMEKDGWTTGLAKLYYVLSQDFLYSNPMNTVVFADNHDLTRYFTSLDEDFGKWKMGMAFLLTTRGIPMIYYGTELLSTGKEEDGHGFIRKDFPGGWEGDTVNAFSGEGLSGMQYEARAYLTDLLNWRREKPVVQHGKLKQFVPENGVYVYCRYDEENTVMVILNRNDKATSIKTARFAECFGNSKSAVDPMTGEIREIGEEWLLPPVTATILELQK